MDVYAQLLASASELDLLKIGERFRIGTSPRTALGVLQVLLRSPGEAPLPQVVDELSDDTLARVCAVVGLPVGRTRAERRQAVLHAADAPEDVSTAMTVEVPRRKPRLAWQGMHRRAAVEAVPTQVVEVVNPGRAERRGEVAQQGFGGLVAARAPGRDRSLPSNRLIWTNDNLVALRTLLDEKDPATRDWRYRGKVDLVYIDPPFMVNNDFSADNSIDIALDEGAGVQAQKEPSLVEILAYKDTWREGLDSFLSMLRERLVLLKQLLAPTGSIYVHLDWHAAHYVKVVMDEVFGYETFRNDITWRRTTAHNDPKKFGVTCDRLLFYAANAAVPYFNRVSAGYSDEQLSRFKYVDAMGRYRAENLTAPGIRPTTVVWRGVHPGEGRHWRFDPTELDRLWEEGRILAQQDGRPRKDGLKEYLHESDGAPVQDLWGDIILAPTDAERLGYPTQKPVALLERILRASCPPGGLVLDCFLGSGTTAEAAERLGRRWIGIDNGKYGIHLARKRLIQLHGQQRPPEKELHDYVECEHCRNVERKPKRQRSPGTFRVAPFTVENMGVYQRAEAWQDIQGERSPYRDEMVRVFGGEPVEGYTWLHGRKGSSWVHVGPLDAPIAVRQVWSIAREAAATDTHKVEVLSADVSTLTSADRDELRDLTGVTATVRIIPKAAIDAVRERLERQRRGRVTLESMAVPAFYAPLAIVLRASVDGRLVKVALDRCEVDIESFLASQQPALKPVTEGMTESARRKAQAELDRWAKRREELETWLSGATSWRAFVDFWAVDWDYGDHLGPDDRPIFDTDWQSFRVRRARAGAETLVLEAELRYAEAGRYRIAARVTDVFGNDGIATVDVEVR